MSNRQRDDKARYIRKTRLAFKGLTLKDPSLATITREFALRKYGDPQKDTILSLLGSSLRSSREYLYACKGDGESWTQVALFVNTGQTDEDLSESLGWGEYYRGPGHSFGHYPCTDRSEHSILVTQSGGLDI